jgi:hypothetical protein
MDLNRPRFAVTSNGADNFIWLSESHGVHDEPSFMERFEQTYSSLFVYPVQPVDVRLTCCLVHATAASNGKGNESIIVALEAIATQLRESLFIVLGYAFDGNSCFNPLYDGLQNAWQGRLSSGPLDSFFGTQMLIPVVVFDQLYH